MSKIKLSIYGASSMLMAGAAFAQTPETQNPDPAEPAVDSATSQAVPNNPADAEPSTEQVGGISEVIVTARRREEKLQDVPISISAIAGRELAERGVFRTEDLMGSIPNVQISSFVGGQTTPNITLRGIGVGNEFNATASSPIGVYIDEDYQGFRPSHGQQLFDMERIEVVKGPQGTLYGRNTTGGAINFISKTPSLGDPTGFVTGRYGNYNAYTIEGAAEFTPITDVLGIRVSATYAKADGYIKNRNPAGVGLTQRDFGETDSRAARIILRLKPSPSLDFTLKGYWGESDPIGVPPIVRSLLPSGTDVSGYSRAGLKRDEAQANSLDEFRNKTKGVTLRSSFGITDSATLISITGYNKSGYFADSDCDGGLNNICDNDFSSDAEQFNEDLRLNLDFERLNLIVGAYYGWQNIKTDNSINYFGFVDDFNYFGDGFFNPPFGTPDAIGGGLFDPGLLPAISGIYVRQRFTQISVSKAIYGEGTYEITPELSLTLGARLTKDKITYKDALTQVLDEDGVVRASVIPFSFPYDPDLPLFRDSQGSKQVTGRAILDYKFMRDAHVFFSYGKGYRAGTYNGFAYQDVDQIYFVPPEKINAYELGLKSRLFDRRVQLNGSIFQYDYKNQQLQEIVGSVGFLRTLDGRVRGAELEGIFQATSDLRVSASLGLLDSKYKKNSKSVIGGTEVGGNEWPFAPKMTFNANANWTFLELGSGKFTVIPEAQYSSRYFYEVKNNPLLKQEGYWLFNGRLTYAAEAGYSVAVYGKNIFNKYYEPWGADTADFGVNYFIRAMPRTYGVEASFRF